MKVFGGKTSSPGTASAERDMMFLVVDDQFNVRRMVTNFLRTFGFHRFVDASDGERAWEKLIVNPIDFVIADWNMPVMNGLEFLRRVRGDMRYRDLPFLMVTAEVSEDIVAEAIEEGVDGYVVKPFQAQTLVDKIEAILEKKRKPDPVEKALTAGKDLLADGQVEQALATLEKVLAANPKSPRTLVALGQALEAMEDNEGALGRYQEAAKLSDRYVAAQDRLASLYDKMGEPELATRHMKKAAKISPRNPNRQLQLGHMLIKSGEAEEGAEALRKALDNVGNDAQLSSEVGEAMLAAGMNAEAAKAFGAAVRLDPKMIHIYNRLGIAYRRQKRFDKAVAEYRRAIEVNPDEAALYYNMAVALTEAGKPADAKVALAQALKLKPDFKEAATLLKRLTDQA